MNAQRKNQQQNKPVENAQSNNSSSLNFELWAIEVKRQMVASLQKRQNEREAQLKRKETRIRLSLNSN
jgi:hypothetical protein